MAAGENAKIITGHAEEQKMKTETKTSHSVTGIGVVFIILSCFCYALGNLFVKMIQDLHPTQISLARFSVQFLLLLPLLTYKRKEEDILGKEGLRKYLWVRGFLGRAGSMCVYMSVCYMPVADAVTIIYSKIVMVPFVAGIFLKEKLSRLEIALAIFSLAGVVLVAQSSFIFPSSLTGKDASNLLGVMYGLLAIIKKLGKTYPPLTIAYYSICGSVLTIILCASLGELRYPCYNDLPLLFSLGFIGVIGQVFLTLGLQRVRAGTTAILQTFQIILIYTLQVLVIHTVPSLLAIIGASFLLISGIIIGIKKSRKKRK